jgi:hypothetical protein
MQHKIQIGRESFRKLMMTAGRWQAASAGSKLLDDGRIGIEPSEEFTMTTLLELAIILQLPNR